MEPGQTATVLANNAVSSPRNMIYRKSNGRLYLGGLFDPIFGGLHGIYKQLT